jgi:hypothetical protein
MSEFYSYFNLVLGFTFILIGLEIYWPFKKESSERMKKWKTFYLIGGIVLLIGGLIGIYN